MRFHFCHCQCSKFFKRSRLLLSMLQASGTVPLLLLLMFQVSGTLRISTQGTGTVPPLGQSALPLRTNVPSLWNMGDISPLEQRAPIQATEKVPPFRVATNFAVILHIHSMQSPFALLLMSKWCGNPDGKLTPFLIVFDQRLANQTKERREQICKSRNRFAKPGKLF